MVLDALLNALGAECVLVGDSIPHRNFKVASNAKAHPPVALLLPRPPRRYRSVF
jgi:hypothetical protein